MQLAQHHVRHSAGVPQPLRESALPRDRELLIARLDAARRRVKLGQDQIDHQSRLIATLFAAGGELEEAENRLHVYQKLQRNYVADVERIADALEHTYL